MNIAVSNLSDSDEDVPHRPSLKSKHISFFIIINSFNVKFLTL